jgi:hypothetical protein
MGKRAIFAQDTNVKMLPAAPIGGSVNNRLGGSTVSMEVGAPGCWVRGHATQSLIKASAAPNAVRVRYQPAGPSAEILHEHVGVAAVGALAVKPSSDGHHASRPVLDESVSALTDCPLDGRH